MNGKLEQPFLVKSGKIVKPLQNFKRAAVESRRRNENSVTAALNRDRAAKLADILFGNLRFSVAFHLEENFILKHRNKQKNKKFISDGNDKEHKA